MEVYKKPYLILWTSCTAAISALERQNFGLAREILLRAQQEAEEAYEHVSAASVSGDTRYLAARSWALNALEDRCPSAPPADTTGT